MCRGVMPAAGPAVSLRCQAQVPAPCRDNKSQQMLADQGWFGPQGDVSLSMEQVRRARAGGSGALGCGDHLRECSAYSGGASGPGKAAKQRLGFGLLFPSQHRP